MPPTPARLVIIDDAVLFATTLAEFCARHTDLGAAACAHSLAEARAILPHCAPVVVLLDNHLPDGLGVDFIPELRHLHPQAAVLMLTAFEDDALIARAIDHGAAGYLLKRGRPEEVVTAIQQARQGEAAMSGYVAGRVLELFRQRRDELPPLAQLSPQENRLMQALSSGASLKEAAGATGITYATARSYLRSIFDKLKVKSQLQAVLRFLGRERL